MVQPLPAVLPDSVHSIVLHCRPRLTFHLGHLRMLNVLYDLLQQGRQVTILVIPYVEHEPLNRTYIDRLKHDYAITRDFYSAYLGYSAPSLTVVSSDELAIDPQRVAEFRGHYRRLYDEGEPSVRALVDEHQRPWSSLGIDFVPKCLAAIAHLSPDAMVAGQKHSFISACFESIFQEAGMATQAFTFDDLLDLRMATGMDRTDSVNTFIEVNDQEDFVIYKLDALRSDRALLSDWLNHFASTVLATCPERARAGITNSHGTDAERIIALSRLLQNVRRMVPYALQPGTDQFRVNWSDELFRSLTPKDKSRIERIATPLYASERTRSVTIYRSYTDGKSGGSVFGVREHSDIDGRHETRTSVMKIGDASALSLEQAAYRDLIAPSKTGAFLEVRSSHSIVEGEAAIVYEDARRHAGASLTGMEPLHSLFTQATPVDRARETMSELLSQHLFEALYRHGYVRDVGSIRFVMNDFLPAQWRIRVEQVDGNLVNRNGRTGVDRVFSNTVEITEVNLERALARAYTDAHDKLDLVLDGLAEDVLAQFTVGKELVIEGTIIDDRENFFRSAETTLPNSLAGSFRSLAISPVRTLDRVSEVFSTEARGVQFSAVHGDLHGGNVLVTPDGHLGVIDYGKARRDYPSMYDVAFLMADLKIRMTAEQVQPSDLAHVDKYISSGRGFLIRRRLGAVLDRLSLFEYESLPIQIRALGSRQIYYGLLAMACLGRLKFDIHSHERLVALDLANRALDRLS
jgi:hypothetical protein